MSLASSAPGDNPDPDLTTQLTSTVRESQIALLRAEIRRLENQVNYDLSVLDRKRRELERVMT